MILDLNNYKIISLRAQQKESILTVVNFCRYDVRQGTLVKLASLLVLIYINLFDCLANQLRELTLSFHSVLTHEVSI